MWISTWKNCRFGIITHKVTKLKIHCIHIVLAGNKGTGISYRFKFFFKKKTAVQRPATEPAWEPELQAQCSSGSWAGSMAGRCTAGPWMVWTKRSCPHHLQIDLSKFLFRGLTDVIFPKIGILPRRFGGGISCKKLGFKPPLSKIYDIRVGAHAEIPTKAPWNP